jgi:geranylgeranyl diphosphate synthase type I
MPFQEEVQYFNRKLSAVIEQKLEECTNEILYDALSYIKDTGGKRLRPIICLLSAEAVGGSREKALSTAIAIELLHNASLVHDDIIDENDIRRKNPSNPARYGEKKAIIIGDLLFGLSCEMLARCGVPEVVSLVSNAVSDIAMGEYLEFTLRTLQDVTEQSYMEVAELKTAATFMASAEAGAVLGGGSEVEIEKLRTYGKNLGIAFQIQDDILDICGDPAETGKPVGLDIKNGERTILVIHALNHSENPEKEYITAILARDSELGSFDIDRVRRILVDAGSIDHALQLSEGFIRNAGTCIAGLEDSEAKQKLQFIADFSQERIKIHVSNTFL